MKKLLVIVFTIITISAVYAQYPCQFQIAPNLKNQSNFSRIDSIQKANQERRSLANNSKSLVWKWDTITTFYRFNNQIYKRYIQQFDANGNVVSRIVERRKNNNWDTVQLCFWSYNSSNQIVKQICEDRFNDGSNLKTMNTFTLDNYGNQIIDLIQNWDNLWLNSYKTSKSYDLNGNLITEIGEKWDGSSWIFDEKQEFVYNNSLLNSQTIYLGTTGTWLLYSKFTWSYDLSGNLISELYQEKKSNSLENFSKMYIIYNSSNSIIRRRFEIWNNNSWNLQNQESYTYNGFGKLDTMFYETWDLIQLDSGYSVFTYNLNQLPILRMDYSLTYGTVRKEEKSYDMNENLISCKAFQFSNGSWNNWFYFGNDFKVLLISSLLGVDFNELGDSIHRFVAHYSQFITNIPFSNSRISTINIFPNPAQNSITIEIPQAEKESFVTIYNLGGQKIMRQQFSGNRTQIDISTLISGIYLVEVRNDKMVEVKKVVKE